MRTHPSSGRRLGPRGLSAAAALAAAMGLAAPAPAQFGEAAGFGEMMSPYYLRRDLVLFSEQLALDDAQTSILESLYFDYEDAHESGKQRMLERISNLRNEMQDLKDDRSKIMELVFQPFEERASEWESLRSRFLVNVQAILNAEQLEHWDAFRRVLRREKELPKGRLSGERINLFHLLDDRALDLDESARRPLEPILNDYDLQLDGVLALRERLTGESRLAMMAAIREEDPQSSVRIYERQVQARVAVRDANDRFAESIAMALSGDLGERFGTIARERAYPRIYRPTAAQRLFAQARQLTDLETETIQAIADLETAYLGELATINESLRGLLRTYEPEEMRYRASSFALRQSGQRPHKPHDPTREQFRNRDQTGRRYVEQLRALLTPEQFASLAGAQRFLHHGNRAKGNTVKVGGRNIARKVLPNQGAKPGLSRDDE